MSFTSIMLDPPWPLHGGGARSVATKYPTIKVKRMPAVIMGDPLWRPDPEGCRVWMWSVSNFHADALWLMGTLGATYVTDWVWRKLDKQMELKMGTGQHRAAGHETLFLGRIGRPGVPPTPIRYQYPSVISAPLEEHSRKPDIFYEMVEAHDPKGRWCEFFARRERNRWRAMGNEI